MLACSAVILLQVICVHVAAQPLPFFYGYMKGQLYRTRIDSTKFNLIGETNFSENRTGGYSYFPMTETGIYWISLRPMDKWSEYDVRVNGRIVATAGSAQRGKSAVGFARFLYRGDVVRVTRQKFQLLLSRGQLRLTSYFSIVLMKRTNAEQAANIFWTATLYTQGIDRRYFNCTEVTPFSYSTGLALDFTQRNRRISWNFTVPWTGFYWVSLRPVPDGTIDHNTYIFQASGRNIFAAWTKLDYGSYASRVVFLQENEIVTVKSNYGTTNINARTGLLKDSMVSVAPLPPGNHLFFGKHWTPYTRPTPFGPGRDVSEQMLPPFAERQTASDSKVRALLEKSLIDDDIRQQYDYDTLKLISFNHDYDDPRGLMRPSNTTLTIQQSGLYLISLRNDPDPIPEGKESIMVMYAVRLGTNGKIILSAVAYPPEYIDVPQGMDCAYFLNAGDALVVVQLDDRGTDYETMWSLFGLNVTG